jgi:hypothetical protein
MSATKINTGVYQYRGCWIVNNHDSETYVGWWQISDINDVLGESEYYPTKRAAMAAIDADPPKGC